MDESKQSPAVVGWENIAITADAVECRCVIATMVDALAKGPKSRARSLAITKLEEAAMWLNESMRVD